MKFLRRLLDLPSPPPAVEASPRQTLHDAVEAQRQAESALAEAVTATARVRKVIAAAAPAESEAKGAAKAAADTTRQWAISGARGPSGEQSALNRAADAQRKAHQAKIRADGASAALPDVIEAEDQARRDLTSAEDAVKGARAQVLITKARSVIAEMEGIQPRYSQLLCELAGLSLLLDPRYGYAHQWRTYVSSSGGQELKRQVLALAIPLPDERDSDLRRSLNVWEGLAKQLAADPEATF